MELCHPYRPWAVVVYTICIIALSSCNDDSLSPALAGDETVSGEIVISGDEQQWNVPLQEGAVVLADERLLGIAFGNLIDNGIRYNRSAGSVEITVFGVDNGLTVQIQDTGEGIPSEELPKIFDRFYRVEKSRTRYRGGAGLGLAICEHIIKLHGGHIKASSTVGEGSNFIIWLPSIASTSFDPGLTES